MLCSNMEGSRSILSSTGSKKSRPARDKPMAETVDPSYAELLKEGGKPI